ncbi:MAG: hypothetical protein ACLP5V_13545, partial [Candidatus Bathyarchaeia archaeon]
MEKTVLTISTVNAVENISKLHNKNEFDLVVVDEGWEKVRRINRERLDGFSYRFFGPRERSAWLRSVTGRSRFKKFLEVVAPRSRGENSLAFLLAFTEGAEYIIELDDDVFPEESFVNDHLTALQRGTTRTVKSREAKWYNTLRSLELENPYGLEVFPRGHPYSYDTRKEDYEFFTAERKAAVLNMGHWTGHPDLDAITILACGAVDGKCRISGKKLHEPSLGVERGTYFSVCSMNTAFRREAVPAMYQLYMSYMGVDRYDDIWSGVFVKKIADHLGHRVTIGSPTGVHDKRPRPVFGDVVKEANGLTLNEELWRAVDRFVIEGGSYWDSYSSLTAQLKQ